MNFSGLQCLRRISLSPCKHISPSQIRYRRHSTQSLTPDSRIYVSKSTDPYFNLSLEDWLFRHHPVESPLLLLYRDDPCVVIGRNQNPWKEVNLSSLRKRPGIPFIRRRSGGGTVYHDLGNTNFSIHLPRPSFDRHVTAQTILRAVRSLAIDARLNDRNDICVGENKVSGSAYKIVNKRAYHHGTMLISTQLDTLGDLLRTNKETMITKGVASVRSPVCNLQQFSSTITHDLFCNAVITEFRNEYGVDDEVCFVEEIDETRNIDHIKKGMQELPSWEWAYGQTPEFNYTISKSFPWGNVSGDIRSKHGIILSCALHVENSSLSDDFVSESIVNLGKLLEGQRYAFVDDAMLRTVTGPVEDIKSWLWSVMES